MGVCVEKEKIPVNFIATAPSFLIFSLQFYYHTTNILFLDATLNHKDTKARERKREKNP
jgi:hypothetical protein